MQTARLESLTTLYVSGALSAGEHDELYRLLLSSPAARELFDRQVLSHSISNPGVFVPAATDYLQSYVPHPNIIPLGIPLEESEPPLRRQSDFAEMVRASIYAWRYWCMGGAL